MSTPVKKVPIHLQSAQNRLIIKHGKIVNEDEITEEDVYIEDGIIKQIGKNLIIPGGTRVIDARGKYILPGGIDPHTHFEFEFMGTTSVDDFYQGTKAAVAGGTTMIIDFAFPRKGESLLDAFYEYRQKADGKVCCDYSLHMCLPFWSEQVKKEMEILVKEHGINSFKMFMAYNFMLNDADLYSAFDTCRSLGALPQVHAENGYIIAKNVEKLLANGITGPEGHELSRSEEVEAEAVNRACVIAKQVGCPLYIESVTTEESGNVISDRKCRGQVVLAEVNVSSLARPGDPSDVNLITSPPLRSGPDRVAQIWGLLAADVLKVVGSDNCTFTKKQKELGKGDFSKIPNGVNGVEDRMSVVWEKGVHSGLIDPTRFVAITSTNAAKIFNLYPRKGCIAVGSDADIVIWNDTQTRTISASTHHQAVDFNVFEGMVCHGVPEFVIVNGRVCVDEGQLRAVQGHGRFVETPVYAPYVYEPEKMEMLKPSRNGADDAITNSMGKVHLEEEKFCPTPTLPDSAVTTPCCKGSRPEGQRNLQDSTFSISEDITSASQRPPIRSSESSTVAHEELDVERKSCIRVKNPPGGRSSGFW